MTITDGQANHAGAPEEPDISQLYQIFPDDVLGSGQFGIVYGGRVLIFYINCSLGWLIVHWVD